LYRKTIFKYNQIFACLASSPKASKEEEEEEEDNAQALQAFLHTKM
jgi:hypothetical protein